MDLNTPLQTPLQSPAAVVRLDTAAVARLEPLARCADRAQVDAEQAILLARLADEAVTRELAKLTGEPVDVYTLDLEQRLLLLWTAPTPDEYPQEPASPNATAAPLLFTPRCATKTEPS